MANNVTKMRQSYKLYRKLKHIFIKKGCFPSIPYF